MILIHVVTKILCLNDLKEIIHGQVIDLTSLLLTSTSLYDTIIVKIWLVLPRLCFD